jgi:stress-induced morphogen
MPIPANEIENLIKSAFPDAVFTLVDTAGDGDHYKLTIQHPSFAGKSRVAQHRMVYDALGGQMGGALHALALETRA